MVSEPTVTDLAIRVSRREVWRSLGYPRSHEPTDRVRRELEAIWPEAVALLRPRGVFRVVDRRMAEDAGMPRPTAEVGVGLCTIGPDLEAEEGRLTAADRMLEALIVDAIGSAAAEAAATALDARVCAEAHAIGLHPRPRISPGYGRWDIRYQRQLLALLPAQALGVDLTEGMMMVPRKSVSFAVRFAPEPGRARRGPCAGCELDDCAFRTEMEDDS